MAILQVLKPNPKFPIITFFFFPKPFNDRIVPNLGQSDLLYTMVIRQAKRLMLPMSFYQMDIGLRNEQFI